MMAQVGEKMDMRFNADPHGTHRKCTDAVLAAIDEEKKAGAAAAKKLRGPLRALRVASATLCALQLLPNHSLKLCDSAFRNKLSKVASKPCIPCTSTANCMVS